MSVNLYGSELNRSRSITFNMSPKITQYAIKKFGSADEAQKELDKITDQCIEDMADIVKKTIMSTLGIKE